MSDGVFNLRKDFANDKRHKVYKKQRLERGWADCDIWNMDEWLMVTIPEMLIALSKRDSYPDCLEIDGNTIYMTARKYRRWLHRNAKRIETYREYWNAGIDATSNYSAESVKKIRSDFIQAFKEIAMNIGMLWT